MVRSNVGFPQTTPMFRGGLLSMSSELKIGLQGYSDLDSGKLRLNLHGGEGCTCKDSDAQVNEFKRY